MGERKVKRLAKIYRLNRTDLTLTLECLIDV